MKSTPPLIRFEDDSVLVLEKPTGLLSQGDHSGAPDLVSWLREKWGRNYVGLVHRLDRNTSGLMVVGVRSASARVLTESLQSGKLVRKYTAWVKGRIKEPQEWEDTLLKDERTNEVRIAPLGTPGGKLSRLNLRPIRAGVFWRGIDLTLAEFELDTGRSHQIRVQSSSRGHALLGDTKYGKGEISRFPRLALHSHFLSFPHPVTHEILEFRSEIPQDLRLDE
jgi:23S rRNA pseudouridine1911/1915/1917 synthase